MAEVQASDVVLISDNLNNEELKSSASAKSIHDSLTDLSAFKLTDVLQNNTNRKAVFLRGRFDSVEGEAVVILEKSAFSEQDLQDSDSNYFVGENSLEKVFCNDIYGDYQYFVTSKLNNIKTTVIHPATEKHVSKYSVQNLYLVDETPKIYNEVVLPHLEEDQFDIQWVYNILEHTSEVDRIVIEDTDPVNGFVMVPDLKWKGEISTLYLLAISNKRDIKSLRDLTEKHLPLLRNIRDKGSEAIKSKYGLDASQLRVYLHYQPSFYHLHIHFCYLRHDAPGIYVEKSHLLSNVISNIELLPDYYQKVTIPYVVREGDNLFKKLESAGVVKCLEK